VLCRPVELRPDPIERRLHGAERNAPDARSL
jgi:hypothetical protein